MKFCQYTQIVKRLTHNGQGFMFGTTDKIRLPGQKPNKEPKIQTTADDQLSSVELKQKMKKELQLRLRCVSRADTKPHVMCTLYCVIRNELTKSHTKHNRFAVTATYLEELT